MNRPIFQRPKRFPRRVRFAVLLFIPAGILWACGPAVSPTSARPADGTIPFPPNPASSETRTPTEAAAPPDFPAPADVPLPDLPVTRVGRRVLPNPDFLSTIVRAPVAWAVSSGMGIKIGVVSSRAEDLMVPRVVAPDAQVIQLQVDSHLLVEGRTLTAALAEEGIRLLVVPDPRDFDLEQSLPVWAGVIAAGIPVLSGIDQTDKAQAETADALARIGVLVVGCLNASGQVIGDSAVLRTIPLFAPDRAGNGRDAALAAAGTAALVLRAEPVLTPAQLNRRLWASADEMYLASNFAGVWVPSSMKVDPVTGDYSPNRNAFRFRRINAASAVGAQLDSPWPVNALNAPAAWRKATGRGVAVAVLDQGFHWQNPVFEGRLVDKAAFVKGKTFESRQNFHGTAMAKIVLAVAPEVSLSFLLTDERMDSDVQAAYVQAIDYAVAHGVRVITNSAGPWANTPEIHAAIDRAIAAEVVYVWFHYDGSNPAVIRPGHFFYSDWEVGAFDRFFDSDKPSDLEGGLSETAPQIAGIAALILQNEPQLTPLEVKRRILETATVLPGGFSLADADAAVENRPTGRTVPSLDADPTNGRMRIVYSEAGSSEKKTLDIVDRKRNWPVAVLPPADVVMFQYLFDENKASFVLVACPEGLGLISMGMALDPDRTLADGTIALSGLAWNFDPQGMVYLKYYLSGSSGNARQMQVSVTGRHVRLSWEDSAGIALYRMTSFSEPTLEADAGFYLYEIEVEGDFLPLAILPVSTY